jgi:hypothetical protein
VASCTAWSRSGLALTEKNGLWGKQYSSEVSLMTWWIECSMGGARELGTGLRYIEMMVIPFENCSTYFRAELPGNNLALASAPYVDIQCLEARLTRDRKSGKDPTGPKRTAWSRPSCNR